MIYVSGYFGAPVTLTIGGKPVSVGVGPYVVQINSGGTITAMFGYADPPPIDAMSHP